MLAAHRTRTVVLSLALTAVVGIAATLGACGSDDGGGDANDIDSGMGPESALVDAKGPPTPAESASTSDLRTRPAKRPRARRAARP